MPNYPDIRTGLGELTPELWRRLMRSLQWYERNHRNVAIKEPRVREKWTIGGGGSRTIPAILLGVAAPLPGIMRWEYFWKPAEWNPIIKNYLEASPATVSDGETILHAINIAEMRNAANGGPYGQTLGTTGGGNPTYGLNLSPIAEDAVVFLTPRQVQEDVNGDGEDETVTRYFFEAYNPLEPECLEGG